MKNGALLIRLDPGEEIVSSIIEVCRKKKITSAIVSGIGACKKAEIAHYNTEYSKKKIEGALEIISLSGNISIKDGSPFPHLHIALGKNDFSVIGGHLVSADVYPTCEIAILPVNIRIERKLDEETGLSLIRFI